MIEAALRAILVDGEAAELVLTRTLRAHPELTRDDRATIANTLHGIALHRGTLFWHLHQRLIPDDGRVSPDDVAAFLRGVAPAAWPGDPVEKLAASRSLPVWLARLWLDELGPEADALAAATNERGPITLRANTLKTSREALAEALEEAGVSTRTGSARNALHLTARANINGLQAWRDGLFEVQDEGSQRIIDLCHAKPGDVVIDWCAGAGGKTLGLAADMRNQGTLIATDVDSQRLADLRGRLKRAGVTHVRTLLLDGNPELPMADVVLVDAPCSSLGTLRRGPDVRWRTRFDDVVAFPERQREILRRASERVKSSGRLVYATCTIHRAENEDVARAFTESSPHFRRDDGATLHLLPHRDGTDGFFAAAWIRT